MKPRSHTRKAELSPGHRDPWGALWPADSRVNYETQGLKNSGLGFFFLLCLLSVEPVGMSQTESNFKLKAGDTSHETTDAQNSSLFSVLLHLRPDRAPPSPPPPALGHLGAVPPHRGVRLPLKGSSASELTPVCFSLASRENPRRGPVKLPIFYLGSGQASSVI